MKFKNAEECDKYVQYIKEKDIDGLLSSVWHYEFKRSKSSLQGYRAVSQIISMVLKIEPPVCSRPLSQDKVGVRDSEKLYYA